MIKVTLVEKPKENKKFPKLMISIYGTVLLITGEKGAYYKGVCIVEKCRDEYAGEYYTEWRKDLLSPYNEPITIQNI